MEWIYTRTILFTDLVASTAWRAPLGDVAADKVSTTTRRVIVFGRSRSGWRVWNLVRWEQSLCCASTTLECQRTLL
jgi:hypothetical protein